MSEMAPVGFPIILMDRLVSKWHTFLTSLRLITLHGLLVIWLILISWKSLCELSSKVL